MEEEGGWNELIRDGSFKDMVQFCLRKNIKYSGRNSKAKTSPFEMLYKRKQAQYCLEENETSKRQKKDHRSGAKMKKKNKKEHDNRSSNIARKKRNKKKNARTKARKVIRDKKYRDHSSS